MENELDLSTKGGGMRLGMLNSFTYYNVSLLWGMLIQASSSRDKGDPFKMWPTLSWKESLSGGSMDLNSFTRKHAFLSQLNFLDTLGIRSKVWETVGTWGTKDDEPPTTVGSRSGRDES